MASPINDGNFAKDFNSNTAHMTNKKFCRDDYPLDVLGEFGLTENMILDLPDFVHDTLEMGGKSPLLPIRIEQPFGYTHCRAKFCLVQQEDGVGVMFAPKLKEADLTNFLQPERDLLLQGKVIVTDVEEAVQKPDGTEEKRKIKAFVQVDLDTNNVVYAPTQIIGRNIQTITEEFDLSDEDIEGFYKGELVTVETPDSNGNPVYLTVGIDLFSDKGVLLVPGNAGRWTKAAHKAMPEYAFGNDGCWVNHHGMLHYVPEDEFTQDIVDAMYRQQRQSGIPMEILAQAQQQQSLHKSEETEEARQITR